MRVIGVISGKGGVGKTTLVANLGIALMKNYGKSVLILDTNLSTPNLSMHFGLDYFPVTLREILNKKAPILESVYIHESGLRIIPAPINIEKNHLRNLKKIKRLRKMIKKLDYDFIIADSSPGLGLETLSTISVVDEIIGITTPELPSVITVSKALELARIMGNKKILGVVVNRRSSSKIPAPFIENICDTNLISTIPDDLGVPEGIARSSPVVLDRKYSKSSIAFKEIAGYLVGEEYKPSFLESIARMF